MVWVLDSVLLMLATSRATIGIKGMNFKADDEIVVAMPVRHKEDDLAIFSSVGTGKIPCI